MSTKEMLLRELTEIEYMWTQHRELVTRNRVYGNHDLAQHHYRIAKLLYRNVTELQKALAELKDKDKIPLDS